MGEQIVKPNSLNIRSGFWKIIDIILNYFKNCRLKPTKFVAVKPCDRVIAYRL